MTFEKGDRLYNATLDGDCCNWADAEFCIMVVEVLDTRGSEYLVKYIAPYSQWRDEWRRLDDKWSKDPSVIINKMAQLAAEQKAALEKAKTTLEENYLASLDKIKTLSL